VSEELDLRAAPGFIEPALHDEFPALRLSWVSVEASPGPSPRALTYRLRTLSNRYHGASVIAMRTQPVPHAYRSFFRQIGLDPDLARIPSEEAAVGRLLHGGFQSTDSVSDALLIALVETGVPVWALDADQVDASGLGIRTTVAGERFGAAENALPAGRLVVADAVQVHALLFGPVAPGHEVGSNTKRISAFAVAVEGVPEIHIEEALWLCADAMRSAGRS
jgi:DNA/RNA-binding domain of Phe-tRNA-synthetase-like protein